jgi:hypothetical protein
MVGLENTQVPFMACCGIGSAREGGLRLDSPMLQRRGSDDRIETQIARTKLSAAIGSS